MVRPKSPLLEHGNKDFQARRMRQDELTEHRSWIQEAKNSLSEMLHTKSGLAVPRMPKKDEDPYEK